MKTATVLMLCAAAAVGACHKDSGEPPPDVPKPHVAAPVAVKKGPSAEELTAGMVEAASQGKSLAPVKLKFDLPQRPMLGQELEVSIAVLPQIDASPAGIQVMGGEGLTVGLSPNQIDLPPLEAGQVYRETFKVTPTVDGVLLLGLTVSLKHDETTDSREFSIPLIVER
ncbi:MAG TPA: hypothetical protein VKG63_01950 [Steroidobacteraceae bacterium]|nr:hypothetical protein [Steroidobacteraceae bacterium]